MPRQPLIEVVRGLEGHAMGRPGTTSTFSTKSTSREDDQPGGDINRHVGHLDTGSRRTAEPRSPMIC